MLTATWRRCPVALHAQRPRRRRRKQRPRFVSAFITIAFAQDNAEVEFMGKVALEQMSG